MKPELTPFPRSLHPETREIILTAIKQAMVDAKTSPIKVGDIVSHPSDFVARDQTFFFRVETIKNNIAMCVMPKAVSQSVEITRQYSVDELFRYKDFVDHYNQIISNEKD